jgi:hypothetical protein
MRLKKKKQVDEEFCNAAFMVPLAGTEELHTDRFPSFHEGDKLLGEAKSLLEKASKMLELDNHSGAMELISKAAKLAPGHPKVLQLKLHAESALLAMMESKLGDLEAVPCVQLRDEEILWLNLDDKTRFVLGKIDGKVSLGRLLSLLGMSRLELARILSQLFDGGVIAVDAGNPPPLKRRQGLSAI